MLFLAAACTHEGAQETESREFTAPYAASGTDVVLIVLDTLRADHLSQYGYARETSPGLRRLETDATRFDRAWAPSPWTLPSSTSIVTGQHPLRHQLRHPGDILGEPAHPLAELLRDAGWHTAGFSHNVNVSPRHGFAQGFDQFTRNTGNVNGYPHAHRLFEAAAEFEAQTFVGPRFAYLQPMNCHGPYRVPAERAALVTGTAPDHRFRYYAGWMKKILVDHKLGSRKHVGAPYLQSLNDQYDAAIRYETDEVGAFLDALDKAGRYDDALVILTADHGEELFDHGGFSHGYSLYPEVLRVPLFVKLPGQSAASVVTEDVSLLDLLPTIVDVTGVTATPDVQDGRSLLPLLHGEAGVPQTLLFDADWRERIRAQAMYAGDWALLHIASNYEGVSDSTLLFDRAHDPGMTEDLAGQDPDRAASMRGALDALVATVSGAAAAPANDLNDADQAQLEALGYLE